MKTTFTLSGLLTLLVTLISFSASAAPVPVTAHDLMTKVYGIAPDSLDCKAVCEKTFEAVALMPEDEGNGFWLDSEDGYSLCYEGLAPDMCAVANFSEDAVKDYTYFFLFPYDSTGKDCVKSDQVKFTGSLLQEIQDRGAEMGADALTDAIFEASGIYGNSLVEVRLTDDNQRFVLMVKVSPDAFGPNDMMVAEL